MSKVLKKPEFIGPISSFCPGCGHSIILRLLAEVIEEMGYKDKSVLVLPVGCAVNATMMWEGCKHGSPHGRAASYATGASRVLKSNNEDVLVISYQGDGDAYAIGHAETHNAAYRGEKMTAIIVNNTNFGMTGGQMGWTTLPGQITKTSKYGRDTVATGHPYHFPEMVAEYFKNTAYAARGAVNNPKNINATKKMLRNALESQANNEGYSVVEVLSPCSSALKMSVMGALDFVDEMIKEFPLGEFKKREGQK